MQRISVHVPVWFSKNYYRLIFLLLPPRNCNGYVDKKEMCSIKKIPSQTRLRLIWEGIIALFKTPVPSAFLLQKAGKHSRSPHFFRWIG